jgi:DNA-binding response OmpR family regulator
MNTSEKQRVLAVDDDPVVRQILHTVLSKDYELILLSSGSELVPLLEGVNPDLVILDVRMPDHSGYDLCRLIRNSPHHSDLPVVFLSSHYEDHDVIKGVRAGADYYLSKPFHSHELRHVVAACLKDDQSSLYKMQKVA